MTKKFKKIFMLLIVTVTTILNVTQVNAATLSDVLVSDENYKFWVATMGFRGVKRTATQESMIRRTSDGAAVYCIQPHIQFNSGSQVNGIVDTNTMTGLTGLSLDQIERIKLISYYGYGYEGHTDPNWYYATQLLIWNTTNPGWVYAIEDNDQTLTPSSRYDVYYNEINSLVDTHTTRPSFNGTKVEMKAGESVTLTDTNRVLEKYYEGYEDDHVKAEIQGNNLVITTKTSYEGKISLLTKENVNQPMLYEGANQLCLSKGDPFFDIISLDIYATENVEVTKFYGKNSDGIYRPEDNAEFEVYNEETNELVTTFKTDNDGKAVINLGYGTYRITQIKGKEGYNFVKDYTFVVDGSKEKEVVYFKNEMITSDLEFTKTDHDTNEALPNTKIEVYNEETGELVFSGTTDEKGQITIEDLGYGKYYILEKEAPTGYEKSDERISFEVTKQGEIIKCNMKDFKIKNVSSYRVPDTATSNNGTGFVLVILLAGALIIVNKIKNSNKK